MAAIAIIPARGGSKRLPRKNILPILDKPMIAHPIGTALESGIFEHVFVSTEDAEIAAIAKEHGAEVLQRSAGLAQDRATVAQVCLQHLADMEAAGGAPDRFCCIYATAIFLEPRHLVESEALLDSAPQADLVMGVSEFEHHPVQALTEQGGYLKPMWPEYLERQSQFYPKLVVSNGTLYWARTEAFQGTKDFYGERLKGFELEKAYQVDIDTPEDFELAKLTAKIRQGD